MTASPADSPKTPKDAENGNLRDDSEQPTGQPSGQTNGDEKNSKDAEPQGEDGVIDSESGSEKAEKPPGPPPEDYPKAPWLPYVLPFLVFMLFTSLFEPTPPEPETAENGVAEVADSEEVDGDTEAGETDGEENGEDPEAEGGWFDFLDFEIPEIWTPAKAIPYGYYPLIYTGKIVLVTLCLAYFWPVYAKNPLKIHPLTYFVGIIGVVLWIVLSSLDVENGFVKPMGLEGVIGGVRSAYNPFDQLGGSIWAIPFLLVRFFGLVAVVAVMEEFFLRGFVVRYFEDNEWWNVPIGAATGLAAAIPSIYGAVSHPEFLAAIVWFSLVTWLILQTRNIWDAVAAHAITNFLLGVYVVITGSWELW